VTNQEETAAVRLGERVLLVDDEESVLFAINEYLTLRGHQVHRAASPEAAHDLLRSHRYGCVITDLHLGPARAGEGIEIARAARESGTPCVVLLTAHGTPELARDAVALGIDRVIAKPVTLADLELVVAGAAEPR
jgi:CheY-like chemotaxis protein